MSHYEKHIAFDPKLPLTFHDDIVTANRPIGFYLHWHEHVEVLYISNGEAMVNLNNRQFAVKKGDIVVINSNTLHSMPTKPVDCTYYCIIISKQFFNNILSNHDHFFCDHINSKELSQIYDSIIREMKEKQPHYKLQVQSLCASLLITLARQYSLNQEDFFDSSDNQKQNIVKKAIAFINSNYQDNITIDSIALHVGFSKYYLCHVFKEMTGQTVIDYVNVLRCNQVKNMISSGSANISQSALSCGFNNLSYFTKTYKKHMGVLPSVDMREY